MSTTLCQPHLKRFCSCFHQLRRLFKSDRVTRMHAPQMRDVAMARFSFIKLTAPFQKLAGAANLKRSQGVQLPALSRCAVPDRCQGFWLLGWYLQGKLLIGMILIAAPCVTALRFPSCMNTFSGDVGGTGCQIAVSIFYKPIQAKQSSLPHNRISFCFQKFLI